MGRITRKWLKVRREWIRQNPPNHQGFYICWICGGWVEKGEMEVDHIQSRSRHPELRFVLSNLAPSCHECNRRKASKEIVKASNSFPQENDDIWEDS